MQVAGTHTVRFCKSTANGAVAQHTAKARRIHNNNRTIQHAPRQRQTDRETYATPVAGAARCCGCSRRNVSDTRAVYVGLWRQSMHPLRLHCPAHYTAACPRAAAATACDRHRRRRNAQTRVAPSDSVATQPPRPSTSRGSLCGACSLPSRAIGEDGVEARIGAVRVDAVGQRTQFGHPRAGNRLAEIAANKVYA